MTLLSDTFLEPYKTQKPDWGPVGEITFLRTYSREGERWWETVKRVVTGCYDWQRTHCLKNNRPWSEIAACHSAEQMYDLMFNFKFLPPGRGLRNMGSRVVHEKGGAALNNCAFVSTEFDIADAASWATDMLMLGVGVGFDTLGAGQVITTPSYCRPDKYVIPDTREGWVESVRRLLLSYTEDGALYISFFYNEIRDEGEPILGSGGVASGPGPLIELHKSLRALLDERIRISTEDFFEVGTLTSADINDIMALVGRCVVSGGVRRSAEIALIEESDTEAHDLKDRTKYPEANNSYRWAANHSVKCSRGADYARILENTAAVDELGVIWMDNVREYSRMGRRPDNKDALAAGANPCVTADTRILTREYGYRRIAEMVGEEVSVWNGHEWSTARPRVTGHNQTIYTVNLSDGTRLDCTPYHNFSTTEGLVPAKDLIPGVKLNKTEMPIVETGEPLSYDAYTHGFFCGDGQGQGSKQGILLYGKSKQLCGPRMSGELSPNVLSGDRQWLGLSSHPVPGKTQVPLNATPEDRVNWLAGLLDSDGTVLQNPNSQMLQISSIDKSFLSDVRLMLTTLGVQAKVSKVRDACRISLPDGQGGSAEFDCSPLYRLCINSTDTYRLQRYGLQCTRLKLNKAEPSRDARRFVTVLKVERHNDELVADKVYCFTEPLRGLGTFEGIVTGQCSEQSLEHKELCCLVEVFPSRISDVYEFQKVLKYAYLYAKTVTTIETHDNSTQAIINRNRRIGCSLTGIQGAIQQKGSSEFYRWCSEGYAYLRQLDRRYSEWLDVARSIKITSVKPSGTVSKLPGVSSGIHFPVSECYFQVIRFASSSPYVEPLRRAGHRCVDLSPDEPNTTAVYFGVIEDNFSRSESEVSMWEQAEHAAKMQHYWADNQVSITIKHNPEDRDQIKYLLAMYEDKLKSVSFFPNRNHSFSHAPWQPAGREEIQKYIDGCSATAYSRDIEHEVEDEFCSGETCINPNIKD